MADGIDGLIPPSFAERIRTYHAAGPDWLRELPDLIASCAERWDLTLRPAFAPGGDASWTAPVTRSTGEPAVLQITVPMPVVHDHVTALRAWAGRGAVRLFAHDAAIQATLMELCVPGTNAAALSPADADDVAVEVLPQLWAADASAVDGVDGVEGVETVAGVGWRAELMEARAAEFGEVVDPGQFREAAQLFTELPASSSRTVLLHGDFHRRNVLLSERGWLAIDPSAMTGDPSFDAAMFLQYDMDDPATPNRVDPLSDRLGLERDRTRAWLFALATQSASWHLSVGDRARHDAYSGSAASLL
jgi:streptomycin 6-kinase